MSTAIAFESLPLTTTGRPNCERKGCSNEAVWRYAFSPRPCACFKWVICDPCRHTPHTEWTRRPNPFMACMVCDTVLRFLFWDRA